MPYRLGVRLSFKVQENFKIAPVAFGLGCVPTGVQRAPAAGSGPSRGSHLSCESRTDRWTNAAAGRDGIFQGHSHK